MLRDVRAIVESHAGSAPVEVRWRDHTGANARFRSRSLRIAVGVLLDPGAGQDAPAVLAGRLADYYLRNGGDERAPAAPDTTTSALTTVSSMQWH